MTAIFGGVNEMAHSLDYHLARQNLLAANIANIETPGYAPRELVRDEPMGKSQFALEMAATKANHIAMGAGHADQQYEVLEEKNVVPGNDLNYVSLDHEMGRIGANALRFKAVGKMVARHLGILRYAAQDAR